MAPAPSAVPAPVIEPFSSDPQFQEQIVESVLVIPRELFPERIEEQIVDIPVPPIVKETAEVVQLIPQEREHVTPGPAVSFTSPASVIEDVTPAPGVTCATPVPVIEHVAPAPVTSPNQQLPPAYHCSGNDYSY